MWYRCGSSPLGSSACLASLRRAAANPEFADWATALPLVSGLRGLTVAVLRVAVEIIPNDGDLLDSWFIPEEERGQRCMRHFENEFDVDS